MKIKTSELVGAALDWAVATCNGGVYHGPSVRDSFWSWPGNPPRYSKVAPAYSTDWAQGGPIIERHIGTLTDLADDGWCAQWSGYEGYGPTPLIAAMRCFVASKLGDEVDVPEELT